MEKDVVVNEELLDEEVDQNEESSIDLDKLDEINQPEEELSEVEKLKKELAQEKRRADELEKQRQKDKAARDKAMKDRGEQARKARELEEQLEIPNEEFELAKQKLAEYELNEKKTSLLLASTDRMAISQGMASQLVDAVYHPDTGEVDVNSLVDSFTTIINDVRKSEFEKGYDLRDTEMASQKPRSRGNLEDQSIAERKAAEYKAKRERNRR